MTRTIALAALAVVAATLAGTLWLTMTPNDDVPYAQCRSSTVAGDIGGPFELVNGDGETVTDADVITEPTLIYFGYTFCPDVCPLDVDRNAHATEILEERGKTLQPVFISIDPKRDTPEVVREFAGYMHPRMVGLTGSDEQVRRASQAYRTYYQAQPADADGEYLVDHTTLSYLVMPDAGFVEFFRRDLSPEQLADKVGCFLS
jgi:protein SCO1/2